MEHSTYLNLLNCVKILIDSSISFPNQGHQSKHDMYNQLNREELYHFIFNRKGHLREDYLTYIMFSKQYGILVRLDYAGTPHENRDNDGTVTVIDTPHVHIFSDQYNNGRTAIPLNQISNHHIANELRDSLIAFLLYNNVDLSDIEIPFL